MLKTGLFNLSGQVVRILTSLICIPVLIKYMGLELYGLWSWATTILTVVQLSEAGLSAGLVYFLSKTGDCKEQTNTILTSCIILLLFSSILACVAIVISSSYFSQFIDGILPVQQEQISSVIRIGALLVGIRITQTLFWAILQARQQYELYSVTSTLQVILMNVAWITLAYCKIDYLPFYMYSSILVGLLINVWLVRLTWHLIKEYSFSFDLNNLKLFFNYNKGAWGSSIGSALFSQGDKLVIANILGPTSLGVYVVLSSICVQLNYLTAQVVHPIFPLVSSYQQDHPANRSNIVESINRIFLINVYLSLIGTAVLITFSDLILSFFLGSNFQKSFQAYFYILSIIYGFYTLSVTGYYILLGEGKSKKVMNVTLVSSIGVLVSIYLLSKELGLLGAVLGNAFFILINKLLLDAMAGYYKSIIDWARLLFAPTCILIALLLINLTFDINIYQKAAIFSIMMLILVLNFFKKYRSFAIDRAIV